MKKNGFTLVELLAVIVILALLAIVSTPIVMNILENSKKSSFASSINGIKKAIENDFGVRDFDASNRYEYVNGVLYFVDKDGEKTVVPMSGGISNGNGIGSVDTYGNVIIRIYTDSYCGTMGVADKVGVTVSKCESVESCKATCGV